MATGLKPLQIGALSKSAIPKAQAPIPQSRLTSFLGTAFGELAECSHRGGLSTYGLSKQTVRSYLCLYLAYMDATALAPRHREDDQALTQDEKNIRWALNKFFYTTKKQSLMTAYTMMLKKKYCDALGVLAEEYPSYYQFRYFYRKSRNLQNFYISRDGLKNYQRNNRPLTGEGVQEFAPAVGMGMLDATVCDIYLVNDTGSLVGRPILTACVDAYSSLCLDTLSRGNAACIVSGD